MKLINVFYLSCFLVISAALIFILNKKDDFSNISCSAKLKMKSLNEDTISHIYFNLALSKNNGWIKIKGDIKNGNDSSIINRKVFFSYTQSKNTLNLNTNEIITYKSDNAKNEILENIFSYAYIYKDSNMDLSIYPQGDGGYFISSTEQHGVYCQP
ncbi:hypothetical protein [Providencia burhodogranariea]|uniref:Uncharacterized protein n=1 Tax=Providencia burhodogranariea DSM 19968 TaxID=1141662 RepID=K8WGJ3_9GAMM|nr:hypothetical protein [Providencia burhodogranariea]EKT55340.1 hypothetical protein OOA_16154 [Providencia burhodogranariea DSM 19968]